MDMLSEPEKAYIAGLFDGEGTLGYYYKPSTGYHQVQLAIYSSDIRVIHWVRDKIGHGSITPHKGKYTKFTNWSWDLSNKSGVVNFLMTIKPYLIVKLDQACLLLSHLDAEQKKNHGKRRRLTQPVILDRQKVVTELKKLKTVEYCVH